MARRIYKRAWLNKPGHHTEAYVVAQWDRDDSCGHLKIADCSRTVSLSIDGPASWNSKGAAENSLYKLDTLIAAAMAMREELVRRMNEDR